MYTATSSISRGESGPTVVEPDSRNSNTRFYNQNIRSTKDAANNPEGRAPLRIDQLPGYAHEDGSREERSKSRKYSKTYDCPEKDKDRNW